MAANSIVSNARDEREMVNLERIFVEVSSVILLRLAKAKPDKNTPADFSSVIIFMDKVHWFCGITFQFVQESPLLTRDALENCLPYSLLRNHFRGIFAPKTTKKQEVASVDTF